MKMKNLLILLTGILLGSVSVYAISVKSTNVTFTPEDTEWDVTSVEEALNDLNTEINNKKVEVIPHPSGASCSSYTVEKDCKDFYISLVTMGLYGPDRTIITSVNDIAIDTFAQSTSKNEYSHLIKTSVKKGDVISFAGCAENIRYGFTFVCQG